MNVIEKYITGLNLEKVKQLHGIYSEYKKIIWPAASYAAWVTIGYLIPEFKSCLKDHMVGTIGFNTCRLKYATKMVQAAHRIQSTCRELEGIHNTACINNSAKLIEKWTRKTQEYKIRLAHTKI